ncbi:MAG: flagellar hook-length control protein FliK [Clostridia bacterium]|nr:flagellar hook-length control protein FliK [Clostridia bacterium]
MKVDKFPAGLNLPEKTQTTLSQAVRAGGSIEENKSLPQGLLNDFNREQELLNRINQGDTLGNRLILKHLLAANMELTADRFAQANIALNFLNRQLMIPKLENSAALTVILAIKLGLADSQDALLAIYRYLTEGPKFLNVLDRMTGDFEKLRLVDDSVLGKILKHFESFKQQLNLDIKSVEQLNKLVNSMLSSPEALLASHSGKAISSNYSLIWQLDKLIAMMQDAGMEKDLSSLMKESILLKQIVLGNILLFNEEVLGNQTFIPFYFYNQRSWIKIFRKKNSTTQSEEELRIEIKIEHNKLGNIRFILTKADRNISTEVFLVSEETKQLIESNIDILLQKLLDLGYNLNIVGIGVINEEEQDGYYNYINSNINMIKISLLDIKA